MQASFSLMVFIVFSTSADGFMTTRLSIPLRPLALPTCRLFSSMKLESHTKNKISSFMNENFPQIPERKIENNDNANGPIMKKIIKNQFQPEFIRNEFILGFRYMLYCFKWLLVASLICHVIQNRVIIPGLSARIPNIMLKELYTPIHYLEGNFKLRLCERMNPMIRDSLLALAIGPITEEVAYRGVVHTISQMGFQIHLLITAWLARFNIGFVYANLAFAAIRVFEYGKVAIDKRILGYWALFLCTAFKYTLLIVPTTKLIKMKKGENSFKETENRFSPSKKWKRSFSEQLVRASRTNSTASALSDFEDEVQQSMVVGARVSGAFEFGFSHIDNGLLSLADASKQIQKGIGTFMSSLLVESRLAVLRKNLWAPIGAHVAYNLLVRVIPILLYLLYFIVRIFIVALLI